LHTINVYYQSSGLLALLMCDTLKPSLSVSPGTVLVQEGIKASPSHFCGRCSSTTKAEFLPPWPLLSPTCESFHVSCANTCYRPAILCNKPPSRTSRWCCRHWITKIAQELFLAETICRRSCNPLRWTTILCHDHSTCDTHYNCLLSKDQVKIVLPRTPVDDLVRPVSRFFGKCQFQVLAMTPPAIVDDREGTHCDSCRPASHKLLRHSW